MALFAQRNRVYQSQFRKEGLGAVLGWIRTKLQRIATGFDCTVKDEESLAENLLDLSAYALMGAMLAEDPAPPESCSHLISFGKEGTATCVLCGRRLHVTIHEDSHDQEASASSL